MSNLKQIGLSIMMYTQDYDEKFPQPQVNVYANVTANNPFGWADALKPYIKSKQIFQCPSESGSPDTNPRHTQYTDYWYNAQFRNQGQAALTSASQTVMSGDGTGTGTISGQTAYVGSGRYA